jgi:phage terminase large subunit-like protein
MIKEIFQSNQLFQAVFPEIIPENFNKTRWSDYIADIPRAEKHPEGTFNAAGVGTALTSRHFTIVNEDDTIAPKKDDLTGDEARPTKEDIQKAIGFHRTVPNLLVDHKTNLVRFIGTRWCQGDPIGWIRENQKNYAWFEMSVWDKTRLPERIPIYPERFDLEVLTALKEEQGSYIFASQYENDPLDESKLKFKEEWLSHFYDRIPEDGLVFMSVDPAISERRKADSIVILAAKLCPNKDVVVLEYIKRKATNRDPAQTVEEVLAMNAKWQPVTIWVETIAYQKALKNLIDQEALKQRVACPTEGFADYSEDSKNVMISALQPIAERGNLWMRSYHTELQQELKDFPYAAHDDVANALAIIVKQGYYPMASAKSAGSEVDLDYTVEKLLKEIRSRNASHGMLAPLHVEFSRQMVQEYLGRR